MMHTTSLLIVLTSFLPTIYAWHFVVRANKPLYQCTVRHPVWKSRRIQVPCPPFANKKLPGGKVIDICSSFTIIPGQDITADNDACDIDECVTTSPCDPDATCTNNPGSFTCACNNGYDGDGFTCTDNDECSPISPCDPDASCINNQGSFTCECNNGYDGNGFSCTDTNECVAGTDNCADDQTCKNTPGSYTCFDPNCPFGPFAPSTGSCQGQCDSVFDTDCFCDSLCEEFGDCCDEFCDWCPSYHVP